MDNRCGFFCFKPKWLQKFTGPKMFVANFSLIGLLRAAYFTYLISITSTVEKRYGFPAKMFAFILTMDNISGIIVSPFVGYLGKYYNGPRIIGFGMLLVSLSSILSGVPYFIYGPGTRLLELNLASQYYNNSHFELCGHRDKVDNHQFESGPYMILCLASFINGLGYSTFWIIGIPYIDNSVKKKNSPLYLSSATVFRLIGVVLGFGLSSYTLSLYEDPFLNVDIPLKDPRWIGAWWLGFIILGITMFFTTIPLFMFPEQEFSKKDLQKKNSGSLGFKDAMISLKKLFTNPIVVFETLVSIPQIIGYNGYWITKPKYIESQYRQSASFSSFLTGSTGVFGRAVGTILGAYLIFKFRPKARVLVCYMFVLELICYFLLLSGLFFGCEPLKFSTSIERMNSQSLLEECNINCECTTKVFHPVCGPNKTTYFSPCYAGCSKSKPFEDNPNKRSYSNCKCFQEDITIVDGFCDEDCSNIKIYLIALSLSSIISSFCSIGNILIIIRAVNPEDKAFMLGIMNSFVSILAYIPYPIIFGFVTDAACLIWEESSNGNCWLYDTEKLKLYLHGTTFTFLMISAVLNIGVLANAHRIKNLYSDDDDETKLNTEMQIKSIEEKKKLFSEETNDNANEDFNENQE